MPLTVGVRQVRLVSIAVAAVGLTGSLAAPARASAARHPTLSDRYGAVGTSHIASIDVNLPIAPTNLVETLDLKTLRIVGGTLPIAPQTVSFTALGVVPVRSTVTLKQAAPITGRIRSTTKGNVLTASVSYSIRLSDVQAEVLGQWVPLQVGDNCRTVDPVVIATSSPAGHYFDVAKGGILTGEYTIGKFQDCAPLNLPDPTGLGSTAVNSLVPGSHNTVRLRLSHGHYVGG